MSWDSMIKSLDRLQQRANEVMRPIGVDMLTDSQISYNKLDFRLKAQICLEYLGSQNRFTEFEAWRDTIAKGSWLEDLVDYCDNEDPRFLDWVSR